MEDFHITINLTNRCNLNCYYCIGEVPYNYIYDDISITTIKFIIKMINMYLTRYNIYIFIGR